MFVHRRRVAGIPTSPALHEVSLGLMTYMFLVIGNQPQTKVAGPALTNEAAVSLDGALESQPGTIIVPIIIQQLQRFHAVPPMPSRSASAT